MGKRSDFDHIPRSKYYTPAPGLTPLLPFISNVRTFIEPCAGAGWLIRHLEAAGKQCLFSCDIEPDAGTTMLRADALQLDMRHLAADAIITNPPWERADLHPMIRHFMAQFPTWLIFDADWKHTVQAGPLLRHCSHIVSVGRLKWIEGSADTGKDNCAWYCFDHRHTHGPRFFGRSAA